MLGKISEKVRFEPGMKDWCCDDEERVKGENVELARV